MFVILSGDLNGRTSNVSQPVNLDFDSFDTMHRSVPVSVGRKSQDSVMNGFGKSLLNMCTALNLCILNGMCHGDLDGRYTYMCDLGSSVIDYFLMSSDLLATVWDKCILNIVDNIETHHMPIVLSVEFPADHNIETVVPDDKVFIDKFVWNSDNVEQFKDAMNADDACTMLNDAIQLIDTDVNLALKMFNDCIKDVASCMKKRVCLNGKKKRQDWYDVECRKKKSNVRRLLRKVRHTLCEEDRFAFCKARREYKNFLLYKRKQHNALMIDKLLASINKQQEFWETVHNIVPRRKSVKNQILLDDWFKHFKKLLERDDENDDFECEDVEGDVDDNDFFNSPITEDEVLLALRKLKPKKAAGPDGVIGEILKYASVFVVPFFVKFFNVLFDKGVFPENWTESVILPLYKKGDVNNPGNYRGISLCDTSSKLYGTIINNRLQAWVEENNITGEFQAGFKKGYSTTDHLFTLMACVQKQFCLNRKLYVAFIDFEKCFDTINRNLLWPVLLKNGIRGKLFCCIRSMYVTVKARIRCGARLTDYVNCSLGVKQGDTCSPVLFSIFINELAIEVINNGRHGVTLSLDAFELFILLLADDVVLLSETVVGLQTQLNSLQRAASRLCLKVNVDKSDIVVFRKGGYLAARERWFFDGNVMLVVNAYKYLGIYFSTRLSFVAACRDIASKAKKALLCIMQRLRVYNNQSLDVFLRLFDAQVQPIMQYGSEVWGLDKAAQHCEKVHLFALKKFLSVNMRTPNDFVYNELNRYPITINSIVSCIRYWLKIVQMDDHRLPKKAYLMLYNLDAKGKTTWVSNVRLCLFQYGFGFVWMNQSVGGVNEFLRVFKERLVDCRWQTWHDHVCNSDRFGVYKSFCGTSHLVPRYLQMNIDRHMKFIMTKFRFGVSDLAVHFYRYRNPTQANLKCLLCNEAEENEIHFVLCCPFFDSMRKQFIAPKYYRNPSAFCLSLLLASNNEDTVRKLCVFLYKAFKAREIAIH